MLALTHTLAAGPIWTLALIEQSRVLGSDKCATVLVRPAINGQSIQLLKPWLLSGLR